MRKQIHPGVAVVIVVAAFIFIIVTYFKKTEPPPTMPMSPLGPGAAMLRKNGGNMSQFMSPDEKRMMAGHGAPGGPAGTPTKTPDNGAGKN